MRNGGLAVAAALATVCAGTQAVSAQPGGDHRPAFGKVDLGAAGGKGLHLTPAAASNRIVTVMLQMQGQPVSVQEAAAQASGKELSKQTRKSIHDRLKSDQDQIKDEIGKASGHVVAQLQWAYNGVQVQVPQKNVGDLAALPGVVAVHKMRTFKPDNTNGVPFIGGPETWQETGLTGKGVKLAVIDTGIDYTHADFGGPGTVEAYKAAHDHSTEADPSLVGPEAPKVKGGYDFVGDAYDANTPGSVPQPDPNPLDCNGHGSHTAGSAAGFGVLADGTTYKGAYNADTVKTNDWNVGPGVAPQADIYAYRVFGCEGSSDVVAAAIDRAVADGVDVISMSLGSPFGGTDDPTTVAAENAAAAGISVVASAGNEGHSGYMVGSPGTGNHVLSVAALDGSLPQYPGAILSFAKGGSVDTIDANGADLPTGSLPVKVLKDGGSISLGCKPEDYQVPGVEGALVVTQRGTCARVARAVFAQQAGAAAVVMVNSSDSLPPYEGPITGNPDTGEQYDVTIPFLGAKKSTAATFLAADGDTVSFTSKPVVNDGYEKAASFTSGGPRNPDSAPKPEVTAPGVSVASVGVGTGNGFAIMSGTSMAAPMTAGTAALVKQAHHDWNGDEIKAAIENTGDPSLNKGYSVRLAGTGAVQARKAVDSTVLAQTDNGLNSLAFGFVPGTGDYRATKSFTLTNEGGSPATYDLSVAANGDQAGSSLSVSPKRVTVAPGRTRTVNATLSIPKAAFAALSSDDTYAVGPGEVNTVRGDVVATPVNPAKDQQTLRVAYLVVPRGLSDVQAKLSNVKSSDGGTTFDGTLRVSNKGIHAGTADVYAWGISDGKDTGGRSMDVRDAGVQVLPGSALGGGDSDRALNFVVNNWGQSANQAANEFDVAIDNDRDGTVDYYVVGVDLGEVLAGEWNGILGSFTIDAASNRVVDAWYADAPMNGSVVVLPALASEVGVDSAHPGFSYTVTGFSILDSSLADPTGSASFDAFRPAVASGQFAQLAPGETAELPLSLDVAAELSDKARGWLVVGVDDASGTQQADEVAPDLSGFGGTGRGNGGGR
jgi:subtilisin family serine protease